MSANSMWTHTIKIATARLTCCLQVLIGAALVVDVTAPGTSSEFAVLLTEYAIPVMALVVVLLVVSVLPDIVAIVPITASTVLFVAGESTFVVITWLCIEYMQAKFGKGEAVSITRKNQHKSHQVELWIFTRRRTRPDVGALRKIIR